MALGMIVFWVGGLMGVYGDQGDQPEEYRNKSYGGLNVRHIVYILSFVFVPVFAFLVQMNQWNIMEGVGLLAALLWALLILVVFYLGYVCFTTDHVTRNRLLVVCVLTLFVTVFWAFFEQAGSSLTLFAEEQVNLVFLNAAQTNSINPGFIQLGLGFLVFALSAHFMSDAGKVSMIFLMIGYLFITSGELFLSPIGLSKVTELSPVKLVSFMMGVWFLSSSFAHYIAGIIAKLTSGDGGHGAEVAAFVCDCHFADHQAYDARN